MKTLFASLLLLFVLSFPSIGDTRARSIVQTPTGFYLELEYRFGDEFPQVFVKVKTVWYKAGFSDTFGKKDGGDGVYWFDLGKLKKVEGIVSKGTVSPIGKGNEFVYIYLNKHGTQFEQEVAEKQKGKWRIIHVPDALLKDKP